jgi:hypothetical protein
MNTESKPMRNLYWEECSQEQQIQRLKDEIISLSIRIGQLTEYCGQLLVHSHNSNGIAVVPMVRQDGLGTLGGNKLPVPHGLRTSDGK